MIGAGRNLVRSLPSCGSIPRLPAFAPAPSRQFAARPGDSSQWPRTKPKRAVARLFAHGLPATNDISGNLAKSPGARLLVCGLCCLQCHLGPDGKARAWSRKSDGKRYRRRVCGVVGGCLSNRPHGNMVLVSDGVQVALRGHRSLGPNLRAGGEPFVPRSPSQASPAWPPASLLRCARPLHALCTQRPKSKSGIRSMAPSCAPCGAAQIVGSALG